MIEFLMGCAFAGLNESPKSHPQVAISRDTPMTYTLPDGTFVMRKGRVERVLDMRPGMIIETED